MNSFSHLTVDEFSKLTEAPLYIGLLIAEADGVLDHKELEWIEKITHFRIKTSHHSLRKYYMESNTFIKENLGLVRNSLPTELDQKMQVLSDKLAEMKPILAKLDEGFRNRLIDSYHSMALSVAEISGGLLNFFSTNPAEERWLALEMLVD
ncbi:MAG: hypothetical protein ACK5UE_02575 [Chitinophagales bacterium]|jgi:hypothetical protein|nr:hypothetical protein [Sphingobacteriales bacterium]